MGDYIALTQSQRVTITLLWRFVIFMIVLLIGSISFNVYLINNKDVYIEIPPVKINQNIEISSTKPSEEYFRIWAIWLEPFLTSFTPESIKDNHEILKGMLHPKRYDDISYELDKLRDDAIQNRVKEYFTPSKKKSSIRVNKNFAEYTLVGSAERYVGGLNKEVKYKYTIRMYNDNGHFYIVGIKRERLGK